MDARLRFLGPYTFESPRRLEELGSVTTYHRCCFLSSFVIFHFAFWFVGEKNYCNDPRGIENGLFVLTGGGGGKSRGHDSLIGCILIVGTEK